MNIKRFMTAAVIAIIVLAVGGYAVMSKANGKRAPRQEETVTDESFSPESTAQESGSYTYPSAESTALPSSQNGQTDVISTARAITENLVTTAGEVFSSRPTAPQTTAAPVSTTAAPVSTTAPAQTTGRPSSTYPYAYAGYNPQPANMNIPDWTLLLVNRNYILPEGYKPELALSVTGDPDSKYLDARVAPHYNEMYLAAQKDGIDLYTVSGYRSYDRQKTNFENKIAKYMDDGMDKVDATRAAARIILPPGTSEHNAGLAMDIISLEQDFENTKAFRWLNEHAADYGFILRYPKDKEDITEIIYEPWHWRYVGVAHAKEIKARGVTLEEYLGVK